MTRTNLLWALALAVILSLAYTRELRDEGVMQERERVYRTEIQRLRERGDSAIVRAHAESARATRLASLAASSVARRGRAVASTDSVVVRVDSVLPTLPDTAQAVVRHLLETVRTERLASDSAIASLSSALDASTSALRASESVVSSLQERLAVQDSLIAVLTRKAHPSFLTRVKRDAVKVASGMALMAMYLASR